METSDNRAESSWSPRRHWAFSVVAVPQETQLPTWSERVTNAVVGQPVNQETLYRLREVETAIRMDATARREETREHVEAIALACAYKLQIMQEIDNAREEAYEQALRQGRVRYVD